MDQQQASSENGYVAQEGRSPFISAAKAKHWELKDLGKTLMVVRWAEKEVSEQETRNIVTLKFYFQEKLA